MSRPYYSVPERLALFGYAVGVAALAYPLVSRAAGLSVPCPLRTLTGIPCPACGLTTAAIALVRGDWAGALAANPAILGLAVLGVVMVPVLVGRTVGALRPAAPASPAQRRGIGWAVVAASVAGELFQLHRFELL